MGKRSAEHGINKKAKKIKQSENTNKKNEETENNFKDPGALDVAKLCDFEAKTHTIDGSWNVAGLKAWIKKDGLSYVVKEDPDILCLQETKCLEKDLPGELLQLQNGPKITSDTKAGYYMYWCNGEKKGYSGVSLWSKQKPLKITNGLGVSEHDCEGRLITAEYEKCYVVTSYVPNSGAKLVRLDYRRKWNRDLKNYLGELKKKKPVIFCGDLNVAHKEIDIANPKTNLRNAGFTKEEREDFTALLDDGYVDTFRKLNPEKIGAYTFWTYMMNARSKNVGWRLDYFIVSKDIEDNICDSVIRSSVKGSDHCPIVLNLVV